MFPQDFVILGFPSNIFGKQEPGSGYDEILNGVTYVRPGGGFVPNMTYFEKVDVNGAAESEIYTFLKADCPRVDDTFRENLFYSPIEVGDVNWNFEKYLLGKDGKVYTRYHPNTSNATDLQDDIAFLLSL